MYFFGKISTPLKVEFSRNTSTFFLYKIFRIYGSVTVRINYFEINYNFKQFLFNKMAVIVEEVIQIFKEVMREYGWIFSNDANTINHDFPTDEMAKAYLSTQIFRLETVQAVLTARGEIEASKIPARIILSRRAYIESLDVVIDRKDDDPTMFFIPGDGFISMQFGSVGPTEVVNASRTEYEQWVKKNPKVRGPGLFKLTEKLRELANRAIILFEKAIGEDPDCPAQHPNQWVMNFKMELPESSTPALETYTKFMTDYYPLGFGEKIKEGEGYVQAYYQLRGKGVTDLLNQTLTQCIICDKPTKLKCSVCAVPYCSKECQIKDWKSHKKTHI